MGSCIFAVLNTNSPIMIYGYIRVSSDKQTVENQHFEISNYCQNQHLSVDDWIQETISGTKAAGERKLGDILLQMQKGDLIICTELSRLGRNIFMVMDILHQCMEKDCRVWTIKEGYKLGDDIQSKVLAFAFGMAAEIERTLISTRTKEALARKRAQGVRLGRPRGTTVVTDSLDAHEDEIRLWLRTGRTKCYMAGVLGCSRNTLYRWLRRKELVA